MFLFFPATEIQNIQIGEGEVCHGINIPIYMLFPRLFTCPTLPTNNFKIGEYTVLCGQLVDKLELFHRI